MQNYCYSYLNLLLFSLSYFANRYKYKSHYSMPSNIMSWTGPIPNTCSMCKHPLIKKNNHFSLICLRLNRVKNTIFCWWNFEHAAYIQNMALVVGAKNKNMERA